MYVCLSVCLSVYLSVRLSIYLSASPSVCLSVCLPVCLSICLFVYPSVCLSVTPAASGVRGTDEQQKLGSVSRTLDVFNLYKEKARMLNAFRNIVNCETIEVKLIIVGLYIATGVV